MSCGKGAFADRTLVVSGGSRGIEFSCRWPQTSIATSAVTNVADGETMVVMSRSTENMAGAPARYDGDGHSQLDIFVDAA